MFFKSVCCGANGAILETMAKQEMQDKGKEEKTNYKLTYFNVRGSGELMRFIFHVAGVEFEDHRVEGNEWAELKPTTKWGKMPILEFDGHSIYSSGAIGRFLAKRYHLVGKDDIEEAMCDEYVDVIQDLKPAWAAFHFEKDEEKKAIAKEDFKEALSERLEKFDKCIEKNDGGKWLVGNSCTWADLVLVTFLDVCELTVDPELLVPYENLKLVKDAVLSIPGVKKYVESRPETSM